MWRYVLAAFLIVSAVACGHGAPKGGTGATPVALPTPQASPTPPPATATPTPVVSIQEEGPVTLTLPEPRRQGQMSLEEALVNRRSVREYAGESLTLEEASQLLWAAQGQTASWGGRTAPSAGALYPLETYLVAGHVDGLSPGVYRYRPNTHDLVTVTAGDVRRQLAQVAVDQTWTADAATAIVISGVFERTTDKYGDRGVRYVYMEAGHAAQNVLLQAAALGLGATPVGAFHDDWLKQLIGMADDETPLYVIPVGRMK